jgi:hypothetical protein
MSAPFNGTKTRVVGFFKGLFGKSGDSVEPVRDDVTYDYYQSAPLTGAQLTPPPAVAPPASNTFKRQSDSAIPVAAKPAATPQVTNRAVTHQTGNGMGGISVGHVNGRVVVAQPSANGPKPAKVANGNGNGIHASPAKPSPPATPKPPNIVSGDLLNLSLASIVTGLPAELQPRLIKKGFDNYVVPVSREHVLAQLSTGAVKITFGELRLNAPQFFTPQEDADDVPVALPLAEILRLINPAQLAKPASQVRITADEEITSPFADKGGNAGLEVKSDAPTRLIKPHDLPSAPTRPGLGEFGSPSAPSANVTPPTRIKFPAAPPAARDKSSAPEKPTVPRAATTPSRDPAPASAQPSAPIPMPKLQSPATAPQPAPTPAPRINGAPALRMAGGTADVSATPELSASVPAPTEVSPSVSEVKPVSGRSLAVSLTSLSETWPAAIKQEIADQNLGDATVELPLDSVASQLKCGRVHFKWAEIRDGLTPRPSSESSQGSVALDLPLKVIAPLFLGLKSGAPAPGQRIKADDAIPNVFAQAAKPAAPAAPIAVPTPTPAPAPVEMTPQAIVKRAAALKGVAGALIALPDGLVVASAMPAGLNGDKVAAFLPQIFARFDACLKDLTMDRLDNLNFTAGKVPWHVFRSSTVFFAVFGRANEPLPTDWLATLAGELDRK